MFLLNGYAFSECVFKGLGIGSGLIVAIGAQNAFVLKQGLKQQYVFWLCLICALSDSILIACGVLGFAEIMTASPILITIAKYLGQRSYSSTVQKPSMPRLKLTKAWSLIAAKSRL